MLIEKLRNKHRIAVLLAAAFILPVALHGQSAGTTSSISGRVFFRYAIPWVGGSYDVGRSNKEAYLVADGDTLRTMTGVDGEFSFTGIRSYRVTLSIQGDIGAEPGTYAVEPFSVTFDLVPGENIVLIHTPLVLATWLNSNEPIMILKEDSWEYHYSSEPSYDLLGRLKGMPGIKYNGIKHTLTISGPAVRKTYVNGAYVFGLNPDAAE